MYSLFADAVNKNAREECTRVFRMSEVVLKNYVSDRGEENAGAAGLTPDTMIDGSCLSPDIVAGIKLLLIDHQFAVEQVHLFNSCMAMRRIVGARREPYQHTHPSFLGIRREQFDGNAGRCLFPFRHGGRS